MYPELGDPGNEYRLKKIDELEAWLQKEIVDREGIYKKYKRVISILNSVDVTMTAIAIAAGLSGIGILSTIVAAPVAIAMEGVGLGVGGLALIAKYISKQQMIKAQKHDEIRILAESKLNTIHNHVQKTLVDSVVDAKEYQLILDEIEKYGEMKQQIRSQSQKTAIDDQLKKELITQGKELARIELLEKLNGQSKLK